VGTRIKTDEINGARRGFQGVILKSDMHRKANEHRTAAGQKGFVLVLGICFSLFKRRKSQLRDAGDTMLFVFGGDAVNKKSGTDAGQSRFKIKKRLSAFALTSCFDWWS